MPECRPWDWRRPDTLVRRIVLRNIRSYSDDHETGIDVPEGVILFEGDIGSGKSTLLYAMEFALFGLSDMKGTHLLSEGKRDGMVSLVVEMEGVEYTIERRLRIRKDDVVQDECSISTNGQRERLSPSDLKERIIAILGFNEPTHPKAESLVYRYAVFTPQEQMKEILTQNPEDRLHVIRRVLGAQSYQVASENSVLVERKLSKLSYGLWKASEGLEEKKLDLKSLREKHDQLASKIPGLESRSQEAAGLVSDLEKERKELARQREGLVEAFGKVDLLQDRIDEIESQLNEDRTSLSRVAEQLSEEVSPIISGFEAKERPKASASELEARMDDLQQELLDFKASKKAVEDELGKNRELVSNGVCPTCGQLLPKSIVLRVEHAEIELAQLKASIDETSSLRTSVDAILKEAEEFEELEKDYKRALKERSRLQIQEKSFEKRISEGQDHLGKSKAKLADAEAHGEELRKLATRIDGTESKLQQARSDKDDARDKLVRAKEQLVDVGKEVTRLSDEVVKEERDSKEARKLAHYQTWLSGFFRPTIAQIERETLVQAAASFNNHFQRFFTNLVDDPDLLVRVNESFSPVFEREGFEQDFEALSGGERTSMALAYRFALNAVIRGDLANQSELLVLDEPTDGFSREQVYRMRDLLRELGSRQVILVSHEKELESMADHIFRVEKKGGASTVTHLGP